MKSIINEVTNSVKNMDLDAFEFDWTRKSSDHSLIYGATVENKLVGLIEFEPDVKSLQNFMYLIEVIPDFRGTEVAGELLAFIGRDSLERGFDGFVVWESKSVYYQYYIDKYGAKPMTNRRLYFDEEATKRLIRIYLEVNYTIDDILKPSMIVSEKRAEPYRVTPEEKTRRERVIAEGEERIRKHGHGIIPPKNPNDLTGLRYIIAIEARLGRKITDSEWEGMSIR